MPLLWITVGTWTLLVIIAEIFAWALFCRKCKGLLFPCEYDQSSFCFFTMGRLRLVIIGHTLLLVAAIIVAYMSLW